MAAANDGELRKYPNESARDFSQRRAFLGWINYVLRNQDADPITDPITDLTDGVALSYIYAGITGKELKGIDLKPKNNKMKCISNLTIVLQALAADGLLLTNVGPQDIYDQNYSLIMGFLWKVVRKYHVGLEAGKSSGSSEESEEDRIRREMIAWTNRRMDMIGESLRVTNLTSDFQDGKVMTAIVASFDASFLAVHKQELSSLSRMRRAFAQSQMVCAVPAILSAVDVHQNPDEKSIMMYLAFFMKLDETKRQNAKATAFSSFSQGGSASFSEGVSPSRATTANRSFMRAKASPGGEQRSVQIGNVGMRNKNSGSGIKPDSRDHPAGFLDTPPPITAPRLPTRKKVFNMNEFTYKIVENPSATYVGEAMKFTVHMSPKQPDTFVDKAVMHDALPVTQIKILSNEEKIPPSQIQFYGFSETHKAGVFGIEFFPTSAGPQVLQLLDNMGNIIFTGNLRDCLESSQPIQNDLNANGQYTSNQSMSIRQGGSDERSFGASSSLSQSDSRLSYDQYGEGEGFSYMSAEKMEMMRGTQAAYGRMESKEENLSRTGKQSRISFYSGNAGVPMRKSVTPFNFDVKDLQDEIEKELEEGQKAFDIQKQQKPLFARTTTLSDNKLLKVFLDDDPELDQFGLRQACITVKYEGIGMRAAQLKETVKNKMCSKLDKAAETRLREYVQYFVIVELTKSGEHRIVGKCEPLGRWEVGLCPPDSRLMFLPIMGHFEFVVDYPLTRVALGENFYVRIEVTDPFRLNKPVKTHNGYLAVVCTSKAGVQTEYEVQPVEGEDGVHTACWQFSESGKYLTMVQFNGHDIQSRPANIKVGKGKPMLRMKGLKTVHKKKEPRDLASSGPCFPKSFHDDEK